MRRLLPLLVLALAGPLCLYCFEGVASACDDGCEYTAKPTVSLTLDGPADQFTGINAAVEHWAINCGMACSNMSKFYWTGITLVYAAAPTQTAKVSGTLGMGSDAMMSSGDLTLSAPAPGIHVFPRFVGGCGDPCKSTMNISVDGTDVIVPPFLNDTSAITVLPDDKVKYASSGFSGKPDEIPLHVPMRITANFVVHPKGSEVATVRVKGGGVDFTGNYGDIPNDDNAVRDQFNKDPKAALTFTTGGTVQMWIEFLGTKSAVRSLTALSDGSDTGADMGTGGSSKGCSLARGRTEGSAGAIGLLSCCGIAGLIIGRTRRRRA